MTDRTSSAYLDRSPRPTEAKRALSPRKLETAHASLAPGLPGDDSPAAAHHQLLTESIARGKQLVLSAALVGDPEDFDVWWRRSRAWTTDMGNSLARIYGDESARTFQSAVPSSPRSGGWQSALDGELERAAEIIALLSALAAERSQTS